MSTFRLNISSPDGKVYSGDAAVLVVRGAEGDLAVLAGHIPLITTVQPGLVALHMEDGSVRQGRTGGGLLTVAKDSVTFLTSSLVWDD